MESKELLTNKPEVGQVAKIKSRSGNEWTAVCVLNQAWEKVWAGGDHFPLEGMEWQPITTPEEARLKERVRELEEEVKRLSETVLGLKANREKLVNRLSAEGLFEDWMDFNY